MIYVYPAELFPTKIRTAAVGFCITCGRVGSMLAPSILLLADKVGVSQMVFYAVLSIITMATSIPLPETFGAKLKETFSDDKPTIETEEKLENLKSV